MRTLPTDTFTWETRPQHAILGSADTQATAAAAATLAQGLACRCCHSMALQSHNVLTAFIKVTSVH